MRERLTHVAFDMHQASVTAGWLLPRASSPELRTIPHEPKSFRRLVEGGPHPGPGLCLLRGRPPGLRPAAATGSLGAALGGHRAEPHPAPSRPRNTPGLYRPPGSTAAGHARRRAPTWVRSVASRKLGAGSTPRPRTWGTASGASSRGSHGRPGGSAPSPRRSLCCRAYVPHFCTRPHRTVLPVPFS
jgi:hypothetical protein